MKKALAIIIVCTLFFAYAGAALASPKSIGLNTTDRAPVRTGIAMMMQVQGYKLVGSDAYRLVFEKRMGNSYEDFVYRDLIIMKRPVLRKLWSVLPGPGGVEAIVDIFLVSSPGTDMEKIYDTVEIPSFQGSEKFDKEKLYDLFNLKASVEGLDPYFIMRASGFFPELKTEIPKADMLVDDNRIIAVLPDGVAGKSGLMPGDYILEVNGSAVEGDIVDLIDSRLAQGNRVMLLVQRGNLREVITFMEMD
ncbi:MAG: PDZ domain-containing protein [Synergistaceae bacterium]|jgi:hypothetical protein|nr:PDZ domain-containing protein [Synergistaceae bacterium]